MAGCLNPPPAYIERLERQEEFRYRLTEAIVEPTLIEGRSLRYRYVVLAQDGTLTLLPGFEWNGPSMVPDAATFMRASALHDALYRIIRADDLPREHQLIADRLLCEVARRDGYRGAGVTWWSVRMFGWMGTLARPRSHELPCRCLPTGS